MFRLRYIPFKTWLSRAGQSLGRLVGRKPASALAPAPPDAAEPAPIIVDPQTITIIGLPRSQPCEQTWSRFDAERESLLVFHKGALLRIGTIPTAPTCAAFARSVHHAFSTIDSVI